MAEQENKQNADWNGSDEPQANQVRDAQHESEPDAPQPPSPGRDDSRGRDVAPNPLREKTGPWLGGG